MSNNVFVWIQQAGGKADSIGWEALGVGRAVANDLGGQLAAIVLGQNVAGLGQEAIQYGADTVFVADDATLANFRLEAYAAVITKLAQEQEPAALIMGPSQAGRELSAYVAAKLGTGLAADCTEVAVEGDSLTIVRPALIGNVFAKVTFGDARPQMVSVRRRVFPVPEMDAGRSGEITNVEAALAEDDIATKVEGFESAAGEVSLTDANIIVSGGRGVAGLEGC